MTREEYFDQLLDLFADYFESNGKKEAQIKEDILAFCENNEVPKEEPLFL